MNYRRKQNKARLSDWYVANKLGLKANEYTDVLKGRRNLANDKLDLFLKLVDINNKEWMNQEDEQKRINEWYDKHDVGDFKKLFKEFKVGLETISQETGLSKSLISMVTTKKIDSDKGKAQVYYFFNDENNRRNEYNKKNKNKITKPSTLTPESGPEESETSSKVEYVTITKEEYDRLNECKLVINDYYKITHEKRQIEEELARYKYLIDLLRNN